MSQYARCLVFASVIAVGIPDGDASDREVARKQADPGSQGEVSQTSVDPQPVTGESSIRVYRTIAASHKGENIVVSPYGVSASMGMIYLGSRGKSATEIRTVMGFEGAPKDLASRFAQIQLVKPSGPRTERSLGVTVVDNGIYGVKIESIAENSPLKDELGKEDLILTIQAQPVRGIEGFQRAVQGKSQFLHVQGFNAFAGKVVDLQRVVPLEIAHSPVPPPKLQIINGMWIHTTRQILPDFRDGVTRGFHANVQRADFAARAEPTRKAINDDIARRSNGMIGNFLPEGAIAPTTRGVIVNALHFKGVWRRPFTHVSDGQFFPKADQPVTVPMMRLAGPNEPGEADYFRYLDIEKLRVLELPYGGSDVSLIAFLPKPNIGLDWLESTLSVKFIEECLIHMSEEKVWVAFPKFTISASYDLSTTLPELGVKEIFTGEADLSGIDGEQDLYISQIRHAATITVDEVGTEGSSGTAAMIDVKASGQKMFDANRPFLFLVRDNVSRELLFLGRVMNPCGAEKMRENNRTRQQKRARRR